MPWDSKSCFFKVPRFQDFVVFGCSLWVPGAFLVLRVGPGGSSVLGSGAPRWRPRSARCRLRIGVCCIVFVVFFCFFCFAVFVFLCPSLRFPPAGCSWRPLSRCGGLIGSVWAGPAGAKVADFVHYFCCSLLFSWFFWFWLLCFSWPPPSVF